MRGHKNGKWVSVYQNPERKFHKKDNPDFTCGMANSETATTHNNPNKELSNHYKPFLKTTVLCDVSEKNI